MDYNSNRTVLPTWVVLINIPQVASDVRTILHKLIDAATGRFIMDTSHMNYDHDYNDRYQDSFEDPPYQEGRGHHRRGPNHRHHRRGFPPPPPPPPPPDGRWGFSGYYDGPPGYPGFNGGPPGPPGAPHHPPWPPGPPGGRPGGPPGFSGGDPPRWGFPGYYNGSSNPPGPPGFNGGPPGPPGAPHRPPWPPGPPSGRPGDPPEFPDGYPRLPPPGPPGGYSPDDYSRTEKLETNSGSRPSFSEQSNYPNGGNGFPVSSSSPSTTTAIKCN